MTQIPRARVLPPRRRRKRVLLVVALALVGLVLVVLLWPTPPPVAERPAPPPAATRPKRPLQADAQGSYVPSYRFTVNGFQFTGLSLRPDAFVVFAPPSGGLEQPVACVDARIGESAVRLRCEDPQVGTVTVDGRFLTRFVADRLDASVLSATVTVRSGSGEVLYSARESFEWRPADTPSEQ
jgi:hypothetical protein